MAKPLAEAARRGLEIGRLEGKNEQVAKFNYLEETRKLVNKWRQDNNLPSTVTPSKKDFPAWTHPFLHRVQAEPLTIAHGTHRPDTGWAQFGHPGPEDKGSPHKQYNPSGEPLFNPLDGGDIVPWDQRPTNDLQANVWGHETPSDTFNRQNYPGRNAPDSLRIDHMRKYHDMKKKELV